MSGLERRYVERVVGEARAAGVEIPAEVLGIAAQVEHGGGVEFDLWRAANPDADLDELVPCCMGVAVYGWRRCECWEAVFDGEQADPDRGGQIAARSRRCGDCAFRKDSKERADAWSEDELLALARAGEPFWCHDGMRRPVAYRHPLLGDVPASPDDWRPPTHNGVPFRADGRPGLLCAGWVQERERAGRAVLDERA